MLNTFVIQKNVISIQAPGNSNVNKIKNDLIWDINQLLIRHYDLYAVFLGKNGFDSTVIFPTSVFLKKLDSMFIECKAISEDEIIHYRKIMDPSKKMTDEVFREICCLENVDMEYIATDNRQLSEMKNMTFYTTASFNKWIKSAFPIYVSLFGAMEMQIVCNCNNIQKRIIDIVSRHCRT